MDSCGYSPINFPLQPLFSVFFFFNVFLSTALLFVQFPIYSIVSLFFGLFPGLYLNFHLYSSIAPTILDSFSVLTFERAYLHQSISFIVAFSLFVFWFFFFPFLSLSCLELVLLNTATEHMTSRPCMNLACFYGFSQISTKDVEFPLFPSLPNLIISSFKRFPLDLLQIATWVLSYVGPLLCLSSTLIYAIWLA